LTRQKPDNSPLVLVTNDDGVDSPGLRSLAEALGSVGDVWVVAPTREMSACSHALNLHPPSRAERVSPQVFAVEGTPADCVGVALFKVLRRRPDLVACGINLGANLAEDVFYSGTVAGAREATFAGLPSIAVSLTSRDASDFGPAARFAVDLARRVIESGLPERTLLNVNVPPGTPTEVAVTYQGRREHEGLIFESLDARRRTSAWLTEGARGPEPTGMSDLFAIRQGMVSVTPLHTDTTNHSVLAALRRWSWKE
jgi:5'-nucleotidase